MRTWVIALLACLACAAPAAAAERVTTVHGAPGRNRFLKTVVAFLRTVR